MFETYEIRNVTNFSKLAKELDIIFRTNAKTMIYGDYDLDGMLSAICWKYLFNYSNHDNFTINRYTTKTHNLSDEFINRCCVDNYEYVIISDAGSNDMDKLQRLSNFGIKTILIDHHICNYKLEDFPPNVLVLNTTIENKVNKNIINGYQEEFHLSCCAFVFILIHRYGLQRGKNFAFLSVLGMISMYSDCIEYRTVLAKSIYNLAKEHENNLPVEIGSFLDTNISRLTRRFAEFTYAPIINATIRSERFELINRHFLDEEIPEDYELISLKEEMRDIHSNIKSIVDTIVDVIDVNDLNGISFVNLNSIGDLYNIKDNKLNNVTGLVANKIVERHNRPCVVVCSIDGSIKGSFRDSKNYDYLSVFKTFIKADGHPSAFGMSIERHKFKDFLENLKIIKTLKLEIVEQEPIVENFDNGIVRSDLVKMASSNEFAGATNPLRLIEMTKKSEHVGRKTQYGYMIYKVNGYNIKSMKSLVNGQKLMVRPYFSKKLSFEVVC